MRNSQNEATIMSNFVGYCFFNICEIFDCQKPKFKSKLKNIDTYFM